MSFIRSLFFLYYLRDPISAANNPSYQIYV